MGGLTEMGTGYFGYRASKAMLNVLTRTLAPELNTRGIMVNSVCPGWVQTDMGGPNATRDASSTAPPESSGRQPCRPAAPPTASSAMVSRLRGNAFSGALVPEVIVSDIRSHDLLGFEIAYDRRRNVLPISNGRR